MPYLKKGNVRRQRIAILHAQHHGSRYSRSSRRSRNAAAGVAERRTKVGRGEAKTEAISRCSWLPFERNPGNASQSTGAASRRCYINYMDVSAPPLRGSRQVLLLPGVPVVSFVHFALLHSLTKLPTPPAISLRRDAASVAATRLYGYRIESQNRLREFRDTESELV